VIRFFPGGTIHPSASLHNKRYYIVPKTNEKLNGSDGVKELGLRLETMAVSSSSQYSRIKTRVYDVGGSHITYIVL